MRERLRRSEDDEMPLDLARHPCFNEHAKKTSARIHLPVAPRCNIQCNYCKHGQDCVNESRPGLTSAVLSPGQALHYLEEMAQRDPRIAVVGIAGPGDPFANAEATMETLRLVRGRFPQMLLCVASNGLGIAPYVGRLAALGVSHVTLTVNAVDPRIGQAIYAWVREEPRVYRGRAAAELLLERQLAAVAALEAQGVTVKINAIIIPGVNDAHIPEVARRTAELGAGIINCVPLYAVPGTPLADVPAPTAEQIASIREAAARFLPVMAHCTRCRADAVGLLGEPLAAATVALLTQSASLPANPGEDRPYVAVATREGALVNQHLGEASQLAIYGREENTGPFSRPGFRHVANRPAPAAGGGRQRWLALAETLNDCRALLVASAGASPCSVLAARGIRVVMMEGLIEEGLEAVYRNVEVRAPLRAQHRCGSGCAGGGQGCS
jgi:nitrogen fixation protein NifB